MSTDTAARHSRRALLGAALGGAAAAAAGSLAAAGPVAAAQGGTALIGNANEGTDTTSFRNTDAGEESLAGIHNDTGTGVRGQTVDGIGVKGLSTDITPSDFVTVDPSHRTGVYGAAGDLANASTITDEVGVYGFADVSGGSAGVWGESPDGTGVFGTGVWGVYGGGAIGVTGDVGPTGTGVFGWVGNALAPLPPAGIGVYAAAESTSLIALQVSGKVKLSRSGRKSIGATKASLKVTMAGVTGSSYVVATMQTNVSGVYVRAVVPTSGSFTIYLSKAPGKTVSVGYVVIN